MWHWTTWKVSASGNSVQSGFFRRHRVRSYCRNLAVSMNILADSHRLPIPDHRNIVIHKAPHQRAQLNTELPQYVTAQCTNIKSPCPFYYFLIKPAQLGGTQHTWLNLCQQCSFNPGLLFLFLCHAVFTPSFHILAPLASWPALSYAYEAEQSSEHAVRRRGRFKTWHRNVCRW